MLNSQLSSIQASGIPIQPETISYQFFIVTQKQVCDGHVFIHHATVLVAATSTAIHHPPHAGRG